MDDAAGEDGSCSRVKAFRCYRWLRYLAGENNMLNNQVKGGLLKRNTARVLLFCRINGPQLRFLGCCSHVDCT